MPGKGEVEKMTQIVLTAVMYSLVAVLLYLCVLSPEGKISGGKNAGGAAVFVLLAAGVGARLFATRFYGGFPADMSCFSAWAQRLFSGGVHSFYSADFFSDYPPGYMYVLWALGALKSAFSLGDGAFYVLLKTPAILCDALTAMLLIKIAQKHTTGFAAMTLGGLYLFSPAVFVNSALWGQVDAVYTLFVFATVYLAGEKRLPAAFFTFALAAIIKPQATFFAPILIFTAAEEAIYPKFDAKRLGTLVLWAIAAIAAAVALALPFGFSNVASQYVGTLSSYRYFSVNAFNFWAMLGLNWQSLTPLSSALTYVVIAAVTVAAGVGFFRTKSAARYFWYAGFICAMMFAFSTKMHERYGFAAIVLLAAGSAVCGRRECYAATAAFGITQFLNVAYVLFFYDASTYFKSGQKPAAVILGILGVLSAAGIIFASVRLAKAPARETAKKPARAEKAQKQIEIIKSAPRVRMERLDLCIIAALMLVYSVPALWDLGDRYAPQNGVAITQKEQSFEIAASRGVTKMALYLGPYHLNKNNTLTVTFRNAAGGITDKKVLDTGSVFCWKEYDVSAPEAASVSFSASERAEIFEAAFYDRDGNTVEQKQSALCDEEEFVPDRISFRNSTYFDEIYHARTAYEFIHGLPVYEWTHPPLGKVFISLGIRLFGMTPFGWRIVGTIFGILMIPAMYIFAKRLFGKTYLAAFCAALFTFDFMHFAQTRIATIDVYVTFFIILMFMLMLTYTRLSFYDTDLKKTLVPLGACGICFGLGVASKWTGMYAGAGLAVLFFASLWRRWREYKFALTDKNGSSDGISHAEIIAKFPKYAAVTVIFCLVFFVLLPLGIYVLSYIPFMRANGTGLAGIWQNQLDMFGYHSNINAEHAFSSPWYKWPIMYRPIWYYSGSISDTVKEGISSFGNPLVWWAAIPAFFYTAYKARTDASARFLCVGYLSGLLPWIPVTRITFIYHYFPCVPFAALMVGYATHGLLGGKRYEKRALAVYALCAAALFAMFYPVLSGQPVSVWYVKHFLKWSSQWIFVSGA